MANLCEIFSYEIEAKFNNTIQRVESLWECFGTKVSRCNAEEKYISMSTLMIDTLILYDSIQKYQLLVS